MLARAPSPMTETEYLAWEDQQLEKWELVDGQPVLRAERKGWITPEGMAGGSYLHAVVCGNIDRALNRRLRGGSCRAVQANVRVRVNARTYRYLDVIVDCGPISRLLYAPEPRIVFEVLSPSNTLRHQGESEEDYKGVASIEQVVFVDTREPFARTWTRAGDLWLRGRAEGLESAIDLTPLGLTLPLAEVYEGWSFED